MSRESGVGVAVDKCSQGFLFSHYSATTALLGKGWSHRSSSGTSSVTLSGSASDRCETRVAPRIYSDHTVLVFGNLLYPRGTAMPSLRLSLVSPRDNSTWAKRSLMLTAPEKEQRCLVSIPLLQVLLLLPAPLRVPLPPQPNRQTLTG